MVLSRLIGEEIERVESAGREELDCGERIEGILDTFSVYPLLDRPVEKKLCQYKKELREEEPSREEYVGRLETILEEDRGSGL